MRQLGEFNRAGKVQPTASEPAEETAANEPTLVGEQGETVDADGELDPSTDLSIDNDLDNDGHDDATGQFVEGNQEATDTAGDDNADEVVD